MLVLVAVASAGRAERSDGWLVADPAYAWSFPADHGAHPDYRTEWWYLTGHLESVEEPTRRFGYQFTIFRVGLVRPADAPDLRSDWSTRSLILGHAALSELGPGRHRFSEVLHRSSVRLGEFTPAAELADRAAATPDSAVTIAWCLPPVGTEEPWTIAWNGAAFDFAATDRNQGFGLRLSTVPRKPLVLQGPNGYSRKGNERTRQACTTASPASRRRA